MYGDLNYLNIFIGHFDPKYDACHVNKNCFVQFKKLWKFYAHQDLTKSKVFMIYSGNIDKCPLIDHSFYAHNANVNLKKAMRKKKIM